MSTGFVRAFASWVIDTFVGDHIFAKLLRSARRKSVTEYWAETKNRDEYIHRFTQEVIV